MAKHTKKLVEESGDSEFHWEEAEAYREIADATSGILPEFSLKAAQIANEEEWMAERLSAWGKKLKYL